MPSHVHARERSIDGLGRDTYTGHTRQRGRRNYFHPKTKFPNTIVPAGHNTRSAYPEWYKDFIQREDPIYHEENSFIASDGRVHKLVVQATDLVYDGADNSTYDRTFIRNISPSVVRLASWTIDQLADRRGWTKRDWALLVGKWVLSCLGLTVALPANVVSSTGAENAGGKYGKFMYRDWGYSKCPRNKCELNPSQRNAMAIESRPSVGDTVGHIEGIDSDSGQLSRREIDEHFTPTDNRTLRPKYLCILNNPGDTDLHGFKTVSVEEWIRENRATTHPDYVFVAFTATQFQGKADGYVLMRLAERAARDAKLGAFWLAYACLVDHSPDGLIEDVWRMSDIVRGAKKTAIVVGHPVDQRSPTDVVHLRDMLLGWGQRMWTLPEALLSPQGSSIPVYMRGSDQPHPVEIDKRSLAVQIWRDVAVSRQLMDHFEGSLILSPLELVVIALQCLNQRSTNDFRIRGEMAYVLMGLLRRRPKVDLTDSEFQAFARLSLANDSSMLLERLICVMSKDQYQAWHDTSDYYDVKLFDIYPTCQIAGVGYNDSVVLDGALGATIRWDRFERVASVHKKSLKRTLSGYILDCTPIALLVGLILIATRPRPPQTPQSVPGIPDPPPQPDPGKPLLAGGIVLLLFCVVILSVSPFLVRLLWTGKLWDTQALFFGFEGYMDIATIETHIFGTNMNRLTWSPFGSTLSRHAPGKHGECVGLDPTTDAETARLVQSAYTAANRPGDYKVFTLVDTLTMTVTMFLAERPPVVVLLCGAEGGMQRAVLCSYQSATQTLCREVVLRMETRTKERMSLVGRLRFSFRRLPVVPADGPPPGWEETEARSADPLRGAFHKLSETFSATFRVSGQQGSPESAI